MALSNGGFFMVRSGSLVATLAFSITASGSAPASAGSTACVAHRGNSSMYLENSMQSLQSAIDLGADFAEFDVHHTRDGRAVILHDSTLKRTGMSKKDRNCPLKTDVPRLLLSDIRENCRLRNGEDVPLLADALERFRSSRTGIVLELKDDPTASTARRVEAAFRNDPGRLVVISFDARALDLFAALLPGLIRGGTRMLHLSRRPGGAERRFDGVGVHKPSLKFVRQVQSEGKAVNVWTVNESKEMAHYIRAEVDYLTTNHPARCLEIAH